MTPFPTLAVTVQGELTSLHYPLFKQEGSARWIILEKAVFKIHSECDVNWWFEDSPFFKTNHSYALALNPCDRSEIAGLLEITANCIKHLRNII